MILVDAEKAKHQASILAKTVGIVLTFLNQLKNHWRELLRS